MKAEILKILEEMGIGYKYLINGLIGAFVWSLYKKLKFMEALRQMFIGSIVAGYLTPLIANKENISPELMGSLSFVVGMLGMIIIDTIYKYVAEKIRLFKKAKKVEEEENLDML